MLVSVLWLFRSHDGGRPISIVAGVMLVIGVTLLGVAVSQLPTSSADVIGVIAPLGITVVAIFVLRERGHLRTPEKSWDVALLAIGGVLFAAFSVLVDFL
ncbi:MAG: hypothetical protein M3451_08960 [Chloroflexota bacterium]|nr:hypothetical protein [Chloroflexota bacterium]